MSDLDIIAQIDEKIHRLPSQVLPELDDYVSFLLQKHSDIEQSVSLEQREKAKQFLAQLRLTCAVGDVISPIDEVWDAAS
jgi:hypothetical protein